MTKQKKSYRPLASINMDQTANLNSRHKSSANHKNRPKLNGREIGLINRSIIHIIWRLMKCHSHIYTTIHHKSYNWDAHHIINRARFNITGNNLTFRLSDNQRPSDCRGQKFHNLNSYSLNWETMPISLCNACHTTNHLLLSITTLI